MGVASGRPIGGNRTLAENFRRGRVEGTAGGADGGRFLGGDNRLLGRAAGKARSDAAPRSDIDLANDSILADYLELLYQWKIFIQYLQVIKFILLQSAH